MKMEREKILIVDDTPANIDVLGAILMSDYDVSVAVSGSMALDIAASPTPPDLILLDIMMPEMDGYEAMYQIKKLNSEMPIIAQTAFALLEEKKKCIDLGFDDYIAKPIKLDELMQKIEKQLNFFVF